MGHARHAYLHLSTADLTLSRALNGLQVLQTDTVKFQFYYESGCPFSIKAYTQQLEKAVKILEPYLDISTYPYGNAKLKLNNSQLTIDCQHGDDECYGNRLHACAMDALKNDPTKYVPFNACMMRHDTRTASNDEAADACGKNLNVNSNYIKDCAKGIRGFQLQLHYGIESRKVTYAGVPWWYINGVSRTGNETKSLTEILCDSFKNPPEVCKTNAESL